MKQGIDIAICTYNRIEHLKTCIDLLLPQCTGADTCITVIDNNSSDNTRPYVEGLAKSHASIRYLFESQQGLSYARNAAWKTSEYEWIFFLDDDCVPPQELVREALILIEKHNEFDALGGPIDPLFIVPPPAWLPEGFGSFSMPFDKVTRIEKGYIRGGCFLIKKNVLEALGGFNPSLGMTGKSLRYAEELALQNQMYKAGSQIGYAPSLKIGHHVRVEKLNLRWILHSEYAKRRDKMVFNPIGKTKATLNLLRTLGNRVIWAPIYGWKALTKINYTWRNALLDTLVPLAYRWGEFVGSLKYRTANPQSLDN